MSKKKSRPLKFAPLQRVDAEPITDPAELAAMDEMRKRLKRKKATSPKASRPSKFAPLQCVVAEEVTDPAELAALEEMLERRRQKQKGRPATKNCKDAKAASNPAV